VPGVWSGWYFINKKEKKEPEYILVEIPKKIRLRRFIGYSIVTLFACTPLVITQQGRTEAMLWALLFTLVSLLIGAYVYYPTHEKVLTPEGRRIRNHFESPPNELGPKGKAVIELVSSIGSLIAGLWGLVIICFILYWLFIGVASLPISIAIIVGAIIIAIAIAR